MKMKDHSIALGRPLRYLTEQRPEPPKESASITESRERSHKIIREVAAHMYLEATPTEGGVWGVSASKPTSHPPFLL